jgi:hypothetical protein
VNVVKDSRTGRHKALKVFLFIGMKALQDVTLRVFIFE